MKIGIDARLYGTKCGGIGRYAQKLIEQLEKIDNGNQYVVFLQKDAFEEYQPKNANFSKVRADFRAYSWQEQLLFSSLIKKCGVDLMHFTHFNVPILYNGKFIVTIHDLIISHYPDSRATTLNPLLYRIKLFFYNIVVKSTAKRAQKIIAVSEYTKNDVVKFLRVAPEKITVTYEGYDIPKEPFDASYPPCLKNETEGGQNSEYLLYVGSAYPHKNLEKLLLTFKKVITSANHPLPLLGKEREEISEDIGKPPLTPPWKGGDGSLKLVLVGKKNFFYDRLAEEIKKLDLHDDVMLPGYISDEKLVCLYKNAKLYVFPSLIEGFGLPPLEAQSYGVPVVSSSATCLPEILGDSAVYFDPQNTEDMAEKILSVLNNENLRQDLISRGYENIKRFSWRDCAQKTLSLYE